MLEKLLMTNMPINRLWIMKRQGETNFYLCEVNRDMVIDATFKGNKSRYINHSCSPNTETQKWLFLSFSLNFIGITIRNHHFLIKNDFFRRIDGETRIGIFATRYVKKGEHLTYDYQYVHITRHYLLHACSLSFL
ncbi:putative [histone H3]-lysine(4) N-trimethyltransferase chromatin remodeling SET family [Helianthus annuus]|nr:putative [histone H3]-lysine(4) N-trimethyltransferase chromatin remodeling SET family [Helianthus annuus]